MLKKILCLVLMSVLIAVSAMALEITVTIDPAIEDVTIDAFAEAYGYQAQIDNPDYNPNEFTINPDDVEEHIPNPQSDKEFMIEKVSQYVYAVYESKLANEAAVVRKTKIEEAETNKDKITAEEKK